MNDYVIKALREGRINKGLKQSDVAEKIGVKGGTLSNYENGISEPDIDTFCELCEIYDLDFSYVLGEAYGLSINGADFDIKPSEIEHIKKYRELDAHGKEMVDFALLKEWERAIANKAILNDNVYSFSAPQAAPVVQAAHNDYLGEDGEVEKVQRDLSALKRPD